MSRRLLWLVPGLLLVALLGFVLALPGFVASSAHRPAVEAFASALTGRQVKIAGKLSLALLPRPEITATRVTIAGPGPETITARALSMDMSLAALLRGRLSAQALSLDAPDIALPWPLPDGARSIAPPPWLAALHARIANGTVTFGIVRVTGVSADIFTGPDGSASLSGTGSLADGQTITLSADLGQIGADETTPLTVRASAPGMSGDFSGTLDTQSRAAGTLTADLGNGFSGKLQIVAEGNGLALASQNITLGGRVFPSLQARLTADAQDVTVQALTLGLQGAAVLGASGSIGRGGVLTGAATLDAPDLAALAGVQVPGWAQAHLAANIGGTLSRPVLGNMQGTLGKDRVSGNLVLGPGKIMGQLAFSHLDLAKLAAWVVLHKTDRFAVDGEITAALAEAGPVALQNLFIDGAVDGGVNIRRASANLYGGLAAGSVTLDSSFQVTAAHGFLDLPSAAALAALAPPGWKPPPALLAPSLNLQFAAQGPPDALAASAVARLGDFILTASPVIDLTKESATGALTLQHPEAIAALKLLGYGADVAFPGPGSLSLRARATAGAQHYGLNDFVLSFGTLTASGQVLVDGGAVAGQVDAGTLTLPALPMPLKLPGRLPVQGKIGLSVMQLVYDGARILGPGAGVLTLKPDGASFALAHADIAGGTLSGTLTATLAATPAISAQFLGQNLDPDALGLPIQFPFTLQSGIFNATGSLTASGAAPEDWLQTLGGTVTVSAMQGSLGGLGLADFGTALGNVQAMRAALTGGVTPFSTLSLAASIAAGNCTLTQASLTAPEGNVSAAGNIDLRGGMNLQVTASPQTEPPVSGTMQVSGPWDEPGRAFDLKAALGWKAAPLLPLPPPPPPRQ